MSRETTPVRQTANDRFKSRSRDSLRVGMLAAVAFHLGLFSLIQPFQVQDLGAATKELVSVVLPSEVEPPLPPEDIPRPARPALGDIDLPSDVTIPLTDFEDVPPETLAPPPTRPEDRDRPRFIPFDTPPRLLNSDQVTDLLQRHYPRSLRDAGIGGRVELWLYVNAEGRVEQSQVKTSSGSAQLDDAARRVAGEMRFSPAKNRDKATDVWVQQWIALEVEDR